MGKFDFKGTLTEVAGVVQPITTIFSAATLVYDLLDRSRKREEEIKQINDRVDIIVNSRLEYLVDKRFEQLKKENTLTIRKETAEQIYQILSTMKVEDDKA